MTPNMQPWPVPRSRRASGYEIPGRRTQVTSSCVSVIWPWASTKRSVLSGGKERRSNGAVAAVERFVDESNVRREVEIPLGDGEMRIAEAAGERDDLGQAHLTGLAPEPGPPRRVEPHYVRFVLVPDGVFDGRFTF